MLLMFDLTLWAFSAGGQDGLFYCEDCCWVVCCKSKPRFCLCYNRGEEFLVISDLIQRFLAHKHTMLLLLSSIFIDDFTHLLQVFVCNLWREDLNAHSVQPKFCRICIGKSTKNLCSLNCTFTESCFEHFMHFRCIFLNFEAQ